MGLQPLQQAIIEELTRKLDSEMMSLMIGASSGPVTGTVARSSPVSGEDIQRSIEQAMKIIKDLPPPEKFDIYGHTLGEGCFEIPAAAREYVTLPGLRCEGHDRRLLIVPSSKLLAVADQLMKAGCDVRIEPRVIPAASDEEQVRT